MKQGRRFTSLLLSATLLAFAAPALADYDTHPELRPANRCVTADGRSFAEAGIDPLHCQRLIWDLPTTVKVGTVAVAAPYAEDPIPRFPRGVTDRPPPLYVLDANRDGVSDNGEGYENPGPGRVPLCPQDHIGWWAPIEDANHVAVIGNDPTGKRHDAEDRTKIQRGPLFRVECRRGTRAYMGPWQLGSNPNRYDFNGLGILRFENTARLNRDVAAARTTENKRIEWNTGSEYYNHFASHHGTCYYPGAKTPGQGPTGGTGSFDRCDDPMNPLPREAYDPGNPKALCRDYQRSSDGPDDPMGKGPCYSEDEDVRCTHAKGPAVRDATQVPGRLVKYYPDGRGIPSVEDVLFNCDHHVVTQLPPGSYGINKLANFRLARGGLRNTTKDMIFDTPPGGVIGGAVGELIIQYFTEPANAPVKPLNWMFQAVPDLATYYPPFTFNYKEVPWTAPYDLKMTMLVLHSHHRMVKGTINLTPNPLRANSPNPDCGGSAGQSVPPLNLYTNWAWEDAPICDLWKDPDGPVVMRKGQVLRAGCAVNNGVTPEAIKHGLIAGDVVETLRTLSNGAIPEDPSTVPTSTWAPAFVNSPVGQQLLYGTHEPENYRVVYKCSTTAPTVPGATAVGVLGTATKICPPNPKKDADGDYVDGTYVNEAICGPGGLCEPSAIAWADRAEDEMCIMVGHYYGLDRIGDIDGGGHDRAVAKLSSGDPNQMQDVGTPGNSPNWDLVGRCWDCKAGL
jgi:hypothetical protein